jgi:hypothetical protein
VQDHYEDGKADLFAAFILRNSQLIQHDALLGMITMQSWMFLSSYETLRRKMLATSFIETMAHLGAGAFDSIGGEVVSTVAFTLRNGSASGKGSYIRLVDVSGDDNQANACAEAVSVSKNYRFEVDQHEFAQIPGSPIAYWASTAISNLFSQRTKLKDIAQPHHGLTTGNNEAMLRFWHEIPVNDMQSANDCPTNQTHKWYAYNKGGDFRKWYGNCNYVIRYDNHGISQLESFPGYRGDGRNYFFKDSLSWSKISSGFPSFRFYPAGFAFSNVGYSIPVIGWQCDSLLGICNSSSAAALLQMTAPTLSFNVNDIGNIPMPSEKYKGEIISALLSTSKEDWDSLETSWDFQRFALLDSEQGAQSGDLLEDAVLHLREYWDGVSEEQREREIRNNELVADAYGVRDDVECDVPLERVSLKRNSAFTYPNKSRAERDELFAQDVVKELISYAVGCMFGRYSLDEPGLILASQGETLDDYHARVPNPSFEPDADNVIPITETDCFEDDIVTRFRRFLEAAFGKENLATNIAYIEQVLGKSIRKYFVNDFYNDHVKMYSNRPIYWQYSSQTSNKGAFKALIYLHRYTPKTTSTVLGYLRDYIGKISNIADALEQSDRTADQKDAAKLRKAIVECKDYEDQTLYPLATRNLEMDLDDGVLVNYLRMGKALRSILAIEKKRKDVSTWTWPIHPLEA